MFDTHGAPTEVLLLDASRTFEEVLMHARAMAAVDAEEDAAVFSTRPTIPIFQGEPWV